jgi:DNA-binding NarL/FixJ family response regulator
MLVVGEEHAADQILHEAERLQPDIIVLDLDSTRGGQLTEDVRSVAPTAKLIFWARDETLMEVLDPSARNARVVAPTAPEELRGELTPANDSNGRLT